MARTCAGYRKNTLGIFAALAVLFTLPFIANAESVREMRVTADVHADASVFVTESVTYDFGANERHGIFRTIPLVYKTASGGTGRVSVSAVDVSDEAGEPEAFTAEEHGGVLTIRIGSPDALVSGVRTYRILYTVRGAIGYFPDHDELYWNVTGNGWEVPIEAVNAAVWTPASASSYACYQGPAGSTERCTSAVSRLDGAGKPIALFSARPLAPGEGLTVAVGVPKGTVLEPTALQKFLQFVRGNGPVALPFVVLAILFALWWRFGRDARGRGTIIPEYDAPAGLSPAAAAMIVYQSVRAQDVSALIIRLAVAGYLKITRLEEKTLGIFTSADYRFDKVKDVGAPLRVLGFSKPFGQENLGADAAPEEKILFDALFPAGTNSIRASEMKKGRQLSRALGKIKTDVGARMVREGYYRARPAYVRGAYIAAAVILAAVSFAVFGDVFSLVSVISVAASCLLILLFAFIMPAKTQKGALAKESILGLKEYLQIAEKNRLDFHNAPEKSPELFEKLLPYAMVLGVSTAWAKEFEGIYTEPPTWYAGGAYPIFSPTAFAKDMRAFGVAAAALAAPTSGSGGAGGGGFSGGGFGGGGGGSW